MLGQGYDSPGRAARAVHDSGSYDRPRVRRTGLPGAGPAGLRRGQLPGPALSGPGLSGGALPGPALPGAGLSGAGLSGAGLSGAGLSGARARPEQGYEEYGYSGSASNQGPEAAGSYSGPGYADQGYQAYGDQRYQEQGYADADTPAYPDQGYSEYGYTAQAQGDAESYPDQGYSTFGYGGQEPSYRGGREQYPDPEATASQQAVSSFPYETDPPTRREQRRRRGRYVGISRCGCVPRAAPTAFAEYRSAGAALRLSPRGDLRTGQRNEGPAGLPAGPSFCLSLYRPSRARLRLLRAARRARLAVRDDERLLLVRFSAGRDRRRR